MACERSLANERSFRGCYNFKSYLSNFKSEFKIGGQVGEFVVNENFRFELQQIDEWEVAG